MAPGDEPRGRFDALGQAEPRIPRGGAPTPDRSRSDCRYRRRRGSPERASPDSGTFHRRGWLLWSDRVQPSPALAGSTQARRHQDESRGPKTSADPRRLCREARPPGRWPRAETHSSTSRLCSEIWMWIGELGKCLSANRSASTRGASGTARKL